MVQANAETQLYQPQGLHQTLSVMRLLINSEILIMRPEAFHSSADEDTIIDAMRVYVMVDKVIDLEAGNID